jgi:hypothetical protein
MTSFNPTSTEPEDQKPGSSGEESASTPDERDAGGRFAAGNRAALQHGARAFSDHGESALTPELREQMAEFRDALVADQGGEGELTALRAGYVRRLVELETMSRLFSEDLRRKGLFTERGHTRAAFRAFLETIDRWDRIAQRLGIDRRAKPAPTLADILAARAADEVPHP